MLAAADTGSLKAAEALETLCRRYWYPLYAYVRRKGYSACDAQDLTQEFFTQLLSKNYLRAADRTRHVDGEMDMLAWDLGNPNGTMEMAQVIDPFGNPITRRRHPMKGPMTTQTLRRLSGLDPLHWRGDRTNFLHFNGAFDSLLGGTILSNADMIAYRAFINTIVFQPNPHQKLDRTLPASLEGGNPAAGRTFFSTVPVMFGVLSCTSCHADPAGADRKVPDASVLPQSHGIKVAHLRNVYQKLTFSTLAGATNLGGFGLTHDGVDGGLVAHFSIHRFDPVLRNDAAKKRDLAGYVMWHDTGMAPAVGYTRTVNAANVNDPG